MALCEKITFGPFLALLQSRRVYLDPSFAENSATHNRGSFFCCHPT